MENAFDKKNKDWIFILKKYENKVYFNKLITFL